MRSVKRLAILSLSSLVLALGNFAHAQEKADLPPALKAVVEKLGAKDVNVRRTAADALGNQRNKGVVPALMAALEDEDAYVRGHAAASLQKLEDRRAVAALGKRVADDRYEIAWEKAAALNALRVLDLDAVNGALLSGLESKNRGVRLWVTQELANQKGKAVVEALIKLLEDKDGDLRGHAAGSLNRIGDRAAVAALIRRIGDDKYDVNWEKNAALDALRVLDLEKVPEALLRALATDQRSVRLWAVQQLGNEKGKAVVEALIKRLEDKDGDMRGYAAGSLNRIGDRTAVPALIRRIGDDKNDVHWEKNAALDALRVLDLEKVTEGLLAALESKNRDVRLWAVQRLATQKEKVVVEALVPILSGKDGDMRRFAADSLSHLSDRSAVDALARRVADSKNEAAYEKDSALGALRRLDPDRVTAALLDALRSEERGVRLWAAQRLSTQKERTVVEALVELLAGKDGDLRGYAADSLGKLEDKAAVAALVKRVADDTSEVSWEKDTALAALRKLDVDRVTEALVGAVKSENRGVRLWAVQRLATQWDRISVTTLIKTLTNKDGDMRGYAADSLGKLGDPEAVPALMKRIADPLAEVNWEKDTTLAALRKLAPERVREALTEAAKSGNESVKTWATAQLAAIKDK